MSYPFEEEDESDYDNDEIQESDDDVDLFNLKFILYLFFFLMEFFLEKMIYKI